MANYSTKFRIRTSDLDEYDHLKLYVYFDFFQDVAGFHAESIGLGYKDTIDKNIAWILMKNKVSIYDYPAPYEIITVKTYPTGINKLDFIRDYEVFNQNNQIIARGTSQWCIIDINTKKILRTNALNFPSELNEPSFYNEKIAKINLANTNELTKKSEYVTQYSDLDHYHHTNNARYAEMIYNAMDLRNVFVTEMILNYNLETPVNKKLSIFTRDNNNCEKIEIEGTGINEDNRTSFSFRIKGNIMKSE